MQNYWPYIAAFLSPVLGFLSAYVTMRLNRSYAETKEGKQAAQKAAEEEAASKKQWREGRIQAEKDLNQLIKEEKSERVLWQLKREGELASIAGILEENTEAHKLLASIAATTQGHGAQISQLHSHLNSLQLHVNNLTLAYPHAKPKP